MWALPLKLVMFVCASVVLLSLQGCFTYTWNDWSDRRESVREVSSAYAGPGGYLINYRTDIVDDDDAVLETVEQFAILTDEDLEQQDEESLFADDMPQFLTAHRDLYTFMFYPVTMRTLGERQAADLRTAMRGIATRPEQSSSGGPGFYSEKSRFFLVTAAVDGRPQVFKVIIPQREFSSGPRRAVKALLFPLAIAGDVITSPAQLLIYLMVLNSSFMM